jgi:hypothetical protein
VCGLANVRLANDALVAKMAREKWAPSKVAALLPKGVKLEQTFSGACPLQAHLSIVHGRHWTPAVNRQPGFRRKDS